jgi:thiosulfate/3-mercaptopyruvate sulfurtransferase
VSFQTLVPVHELSRHLDDAAWRVFDCRFSLADPAAGRNAYRSSHVPGALYADIDEDLSGPRIPGVTGRHPLPDRSEWIARVEEWGLMPHMQAVLYDDSGGAFAARMWWMLRWIGHADAAVLDGSWRAWVEAGLPVTDAAPPAPARAPSSYAERASLTRLAAADDIDGTRQRLLDARDGPRFRGEREPIDPIAGHIPGAKCAPSSENLDDRGLFVPKAALRERFERLVGRPGETNVVCYCGSGITAAHNVLALVHAGFDEPALYAGSWSEWITDSRRGIEIGG